MNKTLVLAGLWSSGLCLLSFIIWMVSFTGIALSAPLFSWTDLEGYVSYVHHQNQFFQYLAKSFMILFSLAFMALAFVYYEFASAEKKILARLALAFAVLFALVSSVHYYVQLTAVRFSIGAGHYEGLEHFLQANPTSFLASVNMLGWTLFLGLSSLFLYLSLKPGLTNHGIRMGLLANAISCLSAGVGFLLQVDVITFIFINIGVGGACILLTFSSVRFFLHLKKNSTKTH
ncbi:MAG: hypothetical protein JW801_03635 [Bacteroidales bacterium]|nr:hypothetical protein [Bacteroidales bacterium]